MFYTSVNCISMFVDPVFFNKATATSMDGMQSGKSSAPPCLFADGKIQESVQSGSEVSLGKINE